MKILLFLLGISPAFANGNHHKPVKQVVIEQSIVNEIDRQSFASLGIANGMHQFSRSTNDWQWSAGAGHYMGSTATSFAIGKRLDNLLLNTSITIEDEISRPAYGLGISGKF